MSEPNVFDDIVFLLLGLFWGFWGLVIGGCLLKVILVDIIWVNLTGGK